MIVMNDLGHLTNGYYNASEFWSAVDIVRKQGYEIRQTIPIFGPINGNELYVILVKQK